MKSLIVIYALAIVTGYGAYSYVYSIDLPDPKPYSYDLLAKPATQRPLNVYQTQGGTRQAIQVTKQPQRALEGLQGNSEDTDNVQNTLKVYSYQ